MPPPPLLSYSDGNINYAVDSNNTAYVASSLHASGDIVLLATIEINGIRYVVTRIDGSAFNGCELRSVVMPDSITHIGYAAFMACTSLVTVRLSASLTTIEGYAFRGNYSLGNLVFPDTLVTLGEGVFSFCISLSSVTLSNTLLTTLNYNTFEGCSVLASVTFPPSLTSISSSVFQTCPALTAVTFPASLTDIGDSAFQGCSSLASITFTGPHLPSLLDNSFQNISANATVYVPPSLLTDPVVINLLHQIGFSTVPPPVKPHPYSFVLPRHRSH